MSVHFGIWGIALFGAAIAIDGFYRTASFITYLFRNDEMYTGLYHLAFDPTYGGFWVALSGSILSVLSITKSRHTIWALWTLVFFGLLLLLRTRLQTGTMLYDPESSWVILNTDLLLSAGLVVFGCCAAFHFSLFKELDEAGQ